MALTSSTSLTLAEAIWPRMGVLPRDLARDVALIVGFAGLVALCAQIAVRLPFTTVPVTPDPGAKMGRPMLPNIR